MLEGFSQHSHFVIALNPAKCSSTMFLQNNMSIVKHLQVLWFEFQDSTISSVSENMIKQNFSNEYLEKRFSYQGFEEKCSKLYKSLSDDLKEKADFFKFLSSSAKLFYLFD